MIKKIYLFLIMITLASCADMNMAKVYFSQGNYEKAFEEFKPMVQKGFPEAYYYSGRIIEGGVISDIDTAEAVKYYERAYELGYEKASDRLGFYYLNLEDNETAKKWLKIASNHNPKAKIELFKIDLQKGDQKARNKIFKELGGLSETDPEYMYLLGYVYEKGLVGKPDLGKSITAYKSSYLKGLDKSGFRYAELIKEKNRDEAIRIYKELFEKGYMVAGYRLGRIYENMAKNVLLEYCPATKAKNAEDYYRFKRDLNKEIYDLYAEALLWYKRSGDLNESKYRIFKINWEIKGENCGDYQTIVRFLELGVKDAVRDYVRLYQSQRCSTNLVSTGSFVVADKYVNGLTLAADNETEDKNMRKYYFDLAISYENEKLNLEKAYEAYVKACEYGSDESEIALAKFNENSSTNLSGGIYYYYAMKNDPKGMFLLGMLYSKLNDEDKYLMWIKKSAELRYYPAVKELTDYYMENGDPEMVVKYLESLTDKFPCFSNLKLGEIYEGKYNIFPDLEKAKSFYEKSLSLECPESYYRLAWYYFYKLTEPEFLLKSEKLLKEYQLIIKIEEPKVYSLLGKIYMTMGKNELAIDNLMKAVKGGETISHDEVRLLLTRYKSIENIFPTDSGGKALLYMAEFNENKDLNLSVCYASKALKQNIESSAVFFLKLASKINTKSGLEFLEKVKVNRAYCENYIKSYYEKKLSKKR